jgi:thioredoxin reductase (NADPH)
MPRMAKPVLAVAVGEPGAAAELAAALTRRFSADYQVVASAEAAGVLDALGRAGGRVAVVIAGQRLEDAPGIEFLCRVHELHPAAKRVLLIADGDAAAGMAGLRAMAAGQLDHWLEAPVGPPELQLYPVVSELLGEWAAGTASAGTPPQMVQVVGPRWSARSHELRDLMSRNNIRHRFCDSDSDDGRRLLAQAGVDPGGQPAVLLPGGQVLVDPSPQQFAEALGVPTRPAAGRYDLAVVGAGPAGLAAATYAASEGLRTLLLERLATGGQAGTTSLIRNYLGFPRGISGRELAWRASQQVIMFGAELVAQPAAGLAASAGGGRVLTLADGSQTACRAVVLATGVSYRRLPVPGLDELLGAGVFYGAAVTEAQAMAGQRVAVVGGANSAGQAAVHLARHAEQVTVVLRGRRLADGMSAYLVTELERAANVTVRPHSQVTAVHGTGRLEALTISDSLTGAADTLPTSAVFILIGAEPHTSWLAGAVERDAHGFVVTGRDLLRGRQPRPGWPLDRPPLPLETSLPGVFAAGDVRHGSIKRVASAVGEGATAIQLASQYLDETSPASPAASSP